MPPSPSVATISNRPKNPKAESQKAQAASILDLAATEDAAWYPLHMVERAMQFILESQARAELRMEKWEARMDRVDARRDRWEARANATEKRLDKRMDAITKRLRHGMRMLAKTETKLAQLAEAQKETDRTLKALIKSLRHSPNGR